MSEKETRMSPETEQGSAWVFGAAVATLLAFTAPAQAPAQSAQSGSGAESSLRDTPEVSEECANNVPSCQTVQSPVISLASGQHQRVQLLCANGSYFWNWAAEVTPHLTVVLHRTVQDEAKRDVGAIFRLDEQTDARPGRTQISIACSPEDPAGKLSSQRRHFHHHPHRNR
jgi:hypothetical protein